MECLQNRIDSFSKVIRVKNPKKSSAVVSLKWPHPPYPKFIATPVTLAEAGFYFTPGFNERDNVTCFRCEKQLAYWEVEDDPFDIHWQKCGTSCSWATVRCGLRGDMNHKEQFTFPDESRFPTSKIMEKARRDTFSVGDGWVHDRAKNHGANSRKMALAGFVFTPQTPGDDLATCLYCSLSLSGWDAEDEPMEEHRKRSNKSDRPCPFFSFLEPAPQPSSRAQTKAASKPQRPPKHSRSASTTKHKDLVVPMKTHDGDGSGDESDIPPVSSRRSTAAKSRQSKGIKTPKAHTRSQSRSTRDTAGSEEEMEEVESEVDVSSQKNKRKKSTVTKQKTRSRSKSVIALTADDEEDMATPRTKPSRSKGPPTEEEDEVTIPVKSLKRRAPTRVADSEEEAENVLRKSTRKPSGQIVKGPTRPLAQKPTRTRKTQAPVDSESQLESEVQATEDEGRMGRKPRQPSGSKAKSLATRKASRSKPKAELVPEESTVDEGPSDSGEPISSAIKPNSGATKGRLKSVKGKGKINAVPQQADDESDRWKSAVSNNDDEMDVLAPSNGSNKQFPGGHRNLATWDQDETNPLYVPRRASKLNHTPSQPSKNAKMEEDAEVSGRKGERRPSPKATEKGLETNRTLFLEAHPEATEEQVNGLNDTDSPTARANEVNLPKENRRISVISPKTQMTEEPHASIGAASRSPSPPLQHVEVQNDVHDVEPEDRTQGDNEPTTPRKTSKPPTHLFVDNAESSELLSSTLPPLSKLPFTPSQSLTDAELDMSVEEWIRYQMEVEYDKFRRDGEREVSRFKTRAEEVRAIIQNL